jgi:deoxyribose-phosphate aldolase
VQAEEVAKTIDHTLLRADGTIADVEALCREAASYHFAAVCLFPHFVPLAASRLKGTDVKTCTVISFPFGADTPRVKMLAADEAVQRGADEVDVVINVPGFLSGEFGLVRDELSGVVHAVRVRGGNLGRTVIVKAIIETCYLDDKMKRLACKICEQAGVDFVKTSTGLGPHGATVEDVELLRDRLDARVGVKASGGIRTAADLERMVSAGAVRVGTSAGVAIMRERLAAGTAET